MPRYRTRIVAEPSETSTPTTYPATRIAPPLIATPLDPGGNAAESADSAISVDSHVSLTRSRSACGIDLRKMRAVTDRLTKWMVAAERVGCWLACLEDDR